VFVKTDTILDKILEQKVLEVREACREPARRTQIEYQAGKASPPRDFAHALHRDTVTLVAEVKKASPSKGLLVEHFDHIAIGKTYAQNGAAAISVLTDEQFFQGSLRYMREVREVVDVPVLRKEFIIDPYQVYEARANNADAVLLIVMALEDQQLRDLHNLTRELGMAALVEVHNEPELERALKIGATVIGINNRDLKTFHEDLGTTAPLARLVPSDVTLVAESAIRSAADVRRMGELGAHAVLVGEALVKADNMVQTVRAFSSQPRSYQTPDGSMDYSR
jgi:indole-3-glycerol phosphate synthase